MEQNKFNEILDRYRTGTATDEEIRLIDAWYAAMGRQPNRKLSHEEREKLSTSFWRSIVARITTKQDNSTVGLWYTIGIAASVTIALLAFLFFMYDKGTTTEFLADDSNTGEWTEISNLNSPDREIDLSDGSSIILATNSVIRLSPLFNKSDRKVLLEGEAIFHVARNEDQPFIVLANGITTRVLGTRFKVTAFKDDKDVTVVVESGKVSVETPQFHLGTSEEVILTPNQQIVYDKHKEKISRRIVEAPQPLLPVEEVKRMRFEQATVNEIFLAIEKVYGIDIEFDESLFSSCTLTTSISEGGLYNRLNIITSAIGAKYSLEEDKIVVTGPGCN